MTTRSRKFLASLSAGLLSAPAVAGDALIHEIMYHPASEATSEENIELKNVGATSVNLHDWEFRRGVSYVFPNITLDAGDYVVVAADTTTFESTYGVAGALGNWTGTLSNRGERLTLVDQNGEEIHDVRYSDQGDWANRIRDTETSL